MTERIKGSGRDRDPQAGESNAPVPGRTERVLVVEDDHAVRELCVSILTGLGYHVTEAPDGHAALALLERDGAVDLLFTDVVMPGGMNGQQLVHRARRMFPAIKVVLTSGYPQGEEGEIDFGDDALLPKPYTNAGLAACIRRALDKN
jgi:CheY-like chemotaxis protein